MSQSSEDDRQTEWDDPAVELPPVRPPSAGFILQLFLVPALIVAAVIGIWALFGRMAAAEHDWQRLVTELRNPNPHVRWPVAHQLAHLLIADQQHSRDGQELAGNPQVVQALTALYAESLHRQSQSEEDLKNLEFLARLMGFLDSPDVVLPMLRESMQPKYDREVRKNAITSVAVIANRMLERGAPLKDPGVVGDLVGISTDRDRLIRQLVSYTLGFFPVEAAQEQLTLFLGDRDEDTRVNAAIAFARQGSPNGYPVFHQVFSRAMDSIDTESQTGMTPTERRQNLQNREQERYLVLINSLKAVGQLADRFSAEEGDVLIRLIEPISEQFRASVVRDGAERTLTALHTQTRLEF